MRKKNANDDEFVTYVRDDLVRNLRGGDVVIWVRLGGSGRCVNAIRQHYNGEVKRVIEIVGASVMFLPRKSKYFNPIELAFGTLKGQMRCSYSRSVGATENRPRRESELREALVNGSVLLTSGTCNGYLRERADGRGFERAFREQWRFISS